MEKDIMKILATHDFEYVAIPNESLKNIHSLFLENKKFTPTTIIEMLYIGVYWEIEKNVTKELKYYNMAAENGYSAAINNLAFHYQKEHFSDIALDYYLKAINDGNSIAMYNLGFYYEKKLDFENMIKYYLVASQNGCVISMYKLAAHYRTKLDFDNMVKYYSMASQNGCVTSMYKLASYYGTELDFNNMVKYYLMILKHNFSDADNKLTNASNKLTNANNKLTDYYLNNNDIDELFFVYLSISRIEIPIVFQKIRNMYSFNIVTICSHFKYLPNGEEFNKIKYDFIVRFNKFKNPL